MENKVTQFHRMRTLFSIVLITIPILTSGQSNEEKADIHSLPTPKNIQQCFSTLDKTMSDREIHLIKSLPEDSLYSNKAFKDGTNFFHAWKLYSGSDLTRYFHKKELYGSYEMYKTILASYHRYLNKREIELELQIKRHREEKDANEEIYMVRLNKDFLNGFYIPMNIEDCMVQLDKIMDENAKESFRIQEESKAVASAYLFNPGVWVRNNWGLCGGSRLQKYFSDQGVKEPEAMSWIILTCYYHLQNGKPIDLEKQVSNEMQKEKRRSW
jgi:hypothetical protein